jgi:hypothetical protein
MIEREELYRRRCVRKVVEVVEVVPGCWRAQSPISLDQTTAGLLLLASWLRCERDFLFRCLEEMGVDIAVFSRRVDGLLNERKIADEKRPDKPLSSSDGSAALCELTAGWLDRAAKEAHLLRQDYLGVEHLLLAFLEPEGSPLALFLSECGIDRLHLTESVLSALRRGQPSSGETAQAATPQDEGFSGVGMPRRFSMAIMMAWMTLFAVAFSVLKWLEAPPVLFVIITILMLGIGLAQMWLFGGKKPRLASIVAGAVVLSVEIVVLSFATDVFDSHTPNMLLRIVGSILLVIPCMPVGALFGYLLGGLTAGIVLTLNYLENRKAGESSAAIDSDAGGG